MGRPSIKNPAILESIIVGIEEGKTLAQVSHEVGPATSTIKKWIEEDEEFSAMYARAREIRADHFADKVAEIGHKVMEGSLLPDAGRVAMDAFKWTAAKMAPRKWGDRNEPAIQLNAESVKVEFINAPERLP